MSGNEVSINLNNGNKVILREGQKGDQLTGDAKTMFNIFDVDNDGELSKMEFSGAKDFSAGIFSIKESENQTTVDYVEDTDKNTIPEYISRWVLDMKGRIIDRIKDRDGDGKTDIHIAVTYNDNGEMNGQLTENFENGNLVSSEAFTEKNGELLTRNIELDENGEQVTQLTVPDGWSVKDAQDAFKELDNNKE